MLRESGIRFPENSMLWLFASASFSAENRNPLFGTML